MTSETTHRARQLVRERLQRARGLGQALTGLTDDPERFVAVARDGLRDLADDAYRSELERMAPHSGASFGVRGPLLAAVQRPLRAPLAESSPASALWLAERLAAEDERELAQLAEQAMRRSLDGDPERTWQLIRRLARQARDWIAVDTLAGLVAHGILNEPFRWAEIEQLVYSADRWERRLVASTIASMPFQLPRQDRSRALSGTPALMIIESLLGDEAADVQKALAWALRSWHGVDPDGVERVLRQQAELAGRRKDGNRARVLRDTLTSPRLDRTVARDVRQRLDGIRRRPGQPSTSLAHAIAREFTNIDRLAERAVGQQGDRQRLAGVTR